MIEEIAHESLEKVFMAILAVHTKTAISKYASLIKYAPLIKYASHEVPETTSHLGHNLDIARVWLCSGFAVGQ
jgi:hypothetical protein